MKFDCLDIESIVGFEWDDENIHKNKNKYGLRWTAIEEVFFNEPLLIVEDFKHSLNECRCVALGQTTISLRLPVDMIEELKVKANAMDVPYQSLIKMFLTNALKSA